MLNNFTPYSTINLRKTKNYENFSKEIENKINSTNDLYKNKHNLFMIENYNNKDLKNQEIYNIQLYKEKIFNAFNEIKNKETINFLLKKIKENKQNKIQNKRNYLRLHSESVFNINSSNSSNLLTPLNRIKKNKSKSVSNFFINSNIKPKIKPILNIERKSSINFNILFLKNKKLKNIIQTINIQNKESDLLKNKISKNLLINKKFNTLIINKENLLNNTNENKMESKNKKIRHASISFPKLKNNKLNFNFKEINNYFENNKKIKKIKILSEKNLFDYKKKANYYKNKIDNLKTYDEKNKNIFKILKKL
jgi:hypothetical protein